MIELSITSSILFNSILFFVIVVWLWGHRNLPNQYRLAALVITVGWIVLVGVPASKGYFEDFSTLPPRIALVLIPMFLFFAWLSIHPIGKKLAQHYTIFFLTIFQTLRIFVELFLALAYQQGQVAKEMTFHGRNFDILIGVSALIIGILIYRKPNWAHQNKKLLLAWNILGILILSIVVFHGIGSAPTQLQFLDLHPPMRLVGTFPYIYLPSVLVCTAYILHILSIRKLRQL